MKRLLIQGSQLFYKEHFPQLFLIKFFYKYLILAGWILVYEATVCEDSRPRHKMGDKYQTAWITELQTYGQNGV